MEGRCSDGQNFQLKDVQRLKKKKKKKKKKDEKKKKTKKKVCFVRLGLYFWYTLVRSARV